MRSPVAIALDVMFVLGPVLFIAVLALRVGYVQRREARRSPPGKEG